MVLRKINAVLSLFTTVLFMNHAIFLSVWMLSRCSIEKYGEGLQWILLWLMIAHAVLSLILVIPVRKHSNGNEAKKYAKMNIPTLVQSISGVLMVLLLGLHIAGAANHFKPKMLHAVLHPVFFAVALAHVSVSTSKAMITLGIGNAKVIRIVDIVMRVLCIVTLVAGVIGFYLCLFGGVGR